MEFKPYRYYKSHHCSTRSAFMHVLSDIHASPQNQYITSILISTKYPYLLTVCDTPLCKNIDERFGTRKGLRLISSTVTPALFVLACVGRSRIWEILFSLISSLDICLSREFSDKRLNDDGRSYDDFLFSLVGSRLS